VKIRNTTVNGCLVVECDRHTDHRGFFQELYHDEHSFDMALQERPGVPRHYWAQACWSKSDKNVLRGLHRADYAKLVTCVSGRIFDVIVDLRSGSPTFKKWVGVELDGNNPTQVYVPANCGHGFLALEDGSSVVYLQSGIWRGRDVNIRYDDPDLAIAWPEAEYIISEKDRQGLTLDQWSSVYTKTKSTN